MPSIGPNSAVAFSNDTTVGAFGWVNPGNAAASDNNKASLTLFSAGNITYYLKSLDYFGSVPSTATIDGLLYEAEIAATGASGNTVDNSVKSVKGGSIGGAEKASGANWPTGDTYRGYGGSSDLWGQTWTPADINSSTFGFVHSAKAVGGGPQTPTIDHVRATVYYTLPSPQDISISFRIPVAWKQTPEVDAVLPVEWSGEVILVTGAWSLPVDWVAPVTAVQDLPAAILSGVEQSSELPVSNTSRPTVTTELAVSWRQTITTDAQLPADWNELIAGAAFFAFPADWKSTARQITELPAGWLAQTIVELVTALPVDWVADPGAVFEMRVAWLQAPAVDVLIPGSWRQTFPSLDWRLPADWSLSIAAAWSAELPVDWLQAPEYTENLSVIWQQQLPAVSVVTLPVEYRQTVDTGEELPVSNIVTLEPLTASLPSDWTQTVITAEQQLPASWLHTASQVGDLPVSSQSSAESSYELPAAWNASVTVDTEAPAEWTTGVQARTADLPSDWLAGLVAKAVALPVSYPASVELATALPAAWDGTVPTNIFPEGVWEYEQRPAVWGGSPRASTWSFRRRRATWIFANRNNLE